MKDLSSYSPLYLTPSIKGECTNGAYKITDEKNKKILIGLFLKIFSCEISKAFPQTVEFYETKIKESSTTNVLKSSNKRRLLKKNS